MDKASQFEALYREHFAYVRGVCQRIVKDSDLAEECAQEAFLRAWRGFDRFEGRSSFRSWMYRVAFNISLEVLQRRKGHLNATSLDGIEIGRSASAEAHLTLKMAMATLAPDQLQAILLRHGQGFSTKEMAQSMGLPIETAKCRLHRACVKVRKAVRHIPSVRTEEVKKIPSIY